MRVGLRSTRTASHLENPFKLRILHAKPRKKKRIGSRASGLGAPYVECVFLFYTRNFFSPFFFWGGRLAGLRLRFFF
jgi:hypothetical protein